MSKIYMPSTTQKSGDTVFMALIPVLIQCFGLILLGFIAGKLKLLTSAQAKGLGVYVTSFALPAIFFTVLVSIDFSDVDWYVILAVSLGKLIIFVLTMTVVIIISRGKSIGLAGLLAIFTSQSNDVALSYPVLRLLYPDLASYVYLFAPAQLVILNPFAYFALEWHRAHEMSGVNSITPLHAATSSSRSSSNCKRILKVMRHVISNPLFFMTAIGVIFNFLLKHKLPEMVEAFFNDLGASFSATALFYLGFNMVDRLQYIDRRGVYVLVSILLGKAVISPFITREVAILLLSHQPTNSSGLKSSFAFVYAAAPSAPPVFLFASKFGILPEVIGAGLMIGTFLYAPIVFVFAGMATLGNVGPQYYDSTLQRAATCLSWTSLLCCVWTLMVLIVTKKALLMPYRFLVCLIVSVMVFCTSVAVGSFWQPEVSDAKGRVSWGQYIEFIVCFIASTGSRVWTVFVCIALFFQIRYKRPLSNAAQLIFYALGVAIPLVVTLVLTLSVQKTSARDVNPAFNYNWAQQVTSMVVLIVCLLTSFLTFLFIFRLRTVFSRRRWNLSALRKRLQSSSSPDEVAEAPQFPCVVPSDYVNVTHREVDHQPLLSPEAEDQPRHRVDTATASTVAPRHQDYTLVPPSPLANFGVAPDNGLPCQGSSQLDDAACHRFFILITLLMISMFFGMCICLWRVVQDTVADVFVMAEFINQILNFGQGVLVFAVFGIDTELIIIPLASCISTVRYWVMDSFFPRSVRLARQVNVEDVDFFVTTHLPACMEEICFSPRLCEGALESAFYFKDFHQWIDRKATSAGHHQPRETTLSLLMALAKRNLVRRLSVENEEASSRGEAESSASNSTSHRLLDESPILFQYLKLI